LKIADNVNSIHLDAESALFQLDLASILIYTKEFNDYTNGHNMRESRSSPALPVPVIRALRKLGHDIRDARRRRRIPVAILAERASISRMTLNKIEKGDTGVYIGNYATVLFALGLIDRFASLADATQDTVGRELEEEQLPERIRLRSPKQPKSPKSEDL
jgi:transcriptional regulator with XRE-family HTH domain